MRYSSIIQDPKTEPGPPHLQTLHGLRRQEPVLHQPHQLVRLLCQTQRQDGVGQDAGEVREEALVDGEEAFRPDRLEQAVEDALVEVSVLVVEAGHDRVWGWER